MAHAEENVNVHEHHILQKDVLIKVFGALVTLTILTVLAAQMPLGPLNVPIALAIAAAKGTLVVLFFMALKYDKRVNAMVFTIGTIFVLIFITFTMFDTEFRGDLGNVGTQTIEEEQAELEQLRKRDPAPEELRVTPSDSPSGSSQGTTPSDSASGDGGEDEDSP